MPNKIVSVGIDRAKRLSKMGEVVPFKQKRARKFRSSSQWQKVVAIQKQGFPMCCDPFNDHKDAGTAEPMGQVHHVKELVKAWHLRAYLPNLRSICTACHAKVSILERQGKPTEYLFKTMPEF